MNDPDVALDARDTPNSSAVMDPLTPRESPPSRLMATVERRIARVVDFFRRNLFRTWFNLVLQVALALPLLFATGVVFVFGPEASPWYSYRFDAMFLAVLAPILLVFSWGQLVAFSMWSVARGVRCQIAAILWIVLAVAPLPQMLVCARWYIRVLGWCQ